MNQNGNALFMHWYDCVSGEDPERDFQPFFGPSRELPALEHPEPPELVPAAR